MMAMALVACGGNDADIIGTYHAEDGSGATLVFTSNSFTMAIPLSEMEIYEIEGYFEITGTYTIERPGFMGSDGVVDFTLDLVALEATTRQLFHDLVDQEIASDPELQELLADPELAPIILGMLDQYMDQEINNLIAEISREEFGVNFFGNNFNRLYDHDENDEVDTIWIRQ